MAMDKQFLQVDQAALRTSARNIIGMEDRMKSALSNAETQISEITTKYKGKISSDNLKKFDEYSLEFGKFCGKIDQYIDFLAKTAATYEATDEGGSSSNAGSSGLSHTAQ